MYNILVCDDDREIVDAIEIYLSQEGYHILKAYDGIEAISVLEKEDVNLLIIDVMMPKLDGIRATLKIREKNSFRHCLFIPSVHRSPFISPIIFLYIPTVPSDISSTSSRSYSLRPTRPSDIWGLSD